MLPVEFARESGAKRKDIRGDRITLVICPSAPRVPTYWVLLDVSDLKAARARLAVREHEAATPSWTEENIGYWDRASSKS